MSQKKDDDAYQPDTEKELICRVQNGNKEALNTFILRFNEDVCRYAFKLTKDYHAANDVTQEVMMAAIRNVGNFKDMGFGIKPWLLKITRRKVRKYFRDNQRHSYVPIDCVDDNHCETKKVEDIDLEYLNVLSEDEKQLLILRYLQGWSAKQIADETSMAIAKVYRILQSAKLRLKGLYLREYIR